MQIEQIELEVINLPSAERSKAKVRNCCFQCVSMSGINSNMLGVAGTGVKLQKRTERLGKGFGERMPPKNDNINAPWNIIAFSQRTRSSIWFDNYFFSSAKHRSHSQAVKLPVTTSLTLRLETML